MGEVSLHSAMTCVAVKRMTMVDECNPMVAARGRGGGGLTRYQATWVAVKREKMTMALMPSQWLQRVLSPQRWQCRGPGRTMNVPNGGRMRKRGGEVSPGTR